MRLPRRITCRRFWKRRRSGSKDSKGVSSTGSTTRERRISSSSPTAAEFCSSNTARPILLKAGPPPIGCSAGCRACPTALSRESTHPQKQRPSGRSANRVRVPPSAVPGSLPRFEGWDDASVAPERLGPYLRDLRKLLNEFKYQAAFYGHFGDGCIHMQVSFDFETEHGIRQYAEFVDRAADLVIRYGGSLSGEHGDGQSRGALLPKMFGDELMRAFAEFKAVWDPGNRMNPHKVIDAYQPTENLRLGADYSPAQPATFFSFPGRQWLVRESRASLHRTRRVPQARLRDDVPELHGDARRAPQHARARAPAVGTAARRGPQRFVEERRGQGIA